MEAGQNFPKHPAVAKHIPRGKTDGREPDTLGVRALDKPLHTVPVDQFPGGQQVTGLVDVGHLAAKRAGSKHRAGKLTQFGPDLLNQAEALVISEAYTAGHPSPGFDQKEVDHIPGHRLYRVPKVLAAGFRRQA